MALLKKVIPGYRYRLSGALLNALIRFHNQWRNLHVEAGVEELAHGRIIKGEGRSVLRLALPTSAARGGSGGTVITAHSFTVCINGAPATRWMLDWESDPGTPDPAILPSGYSFEAFTECISGTPTDLWLVTWTADPGSSGVDDLPASYAFLEFSYCDSGTPATRWLATWTSDPS